MKFELKDKVIIITGASSGIGAATALALAKKGAKVTLTARNEAKLKELTTLCNQHSECWYFVADITNADACNHIIQSTVKKYGRLDVLITNAGLSVRSLAEDCSFDVYQKLMKVNFFGALYCINPAIPHLLSSRGMLVGISSVSGIHGLPARSGYAASKSAINGFLTSVKIENLKTGMHVVTVCPGFTSSNIRLNALDGQGNPQGFTPRDEKKMMMPEDVANRVIRAMENKEHFVVLTKQGKILHFLSRYFPRVASALIFREMAKEPNSLLRMGPTTLEG